MGRAKRWTLGLTEVVAYADRTGWYVVITPPYAAICAGARHAPYLHAHPVRGHPRHLPRLPLAPDLDLRETVAAMRLLCAGLDRAPSLVELQEALL